MQKKISLSFLIIILLSILSTAECDDFKITAFYPSPHANYNRLRLVPRAALTPSTNCKLGNFYANSDDSHSTIYYCSSNIVSTQYLPIPGTWTQNGNDLYISDTANPINKKVSIGSTNPIFKLTLDVDGGILASGTSAGGTSLTTSGAGTRLVWYPLKTTFLAGKVDGSQWDNAQLTDSNIAIGYNNSTTSAYCKAIGGESNIAGDPVLSAAGALTLGGKSNYTRAAPGFIVGGENNNIRQNSHGYIIGGFNNDISNGNYNAILGGTSNYIAEYSDLISGGSSNRIARTVHLFDSLGNSTIGGGLQNIISARAYNVISGGRQNSISLDTTASANIIGGRQNSISLHYSTINGGQTNTASSQYGTISGGYSNTVSAQFATISGGHSNSITANYGTIAGGYQNSVTGQYSTIFGGQQNSISGTCSSILGGTNNSIASNYSFAFGKNMQLGASSSTTFLWGYSETPLASPIQADHAFIIYSGNVGIRDTTPEALLEINANGLPDDLLALTSNTSSPVGDELMVKNNGYIGIGTPSPTYPLQFANGAYVTTTGQFMSASSRHFKNHIQKLSNSEAMQLMQKLTPVSFNYKNSPNESYLGFIAEDVPDLLADKNHKGLAPLDFAAILANISRQQKIMIHKQELRRQKLKQRLANIEKQLAVSRQSTKE